MILSRRPASGSQGKRFRASAKQTKVIIKRDLKLAMSSWHVRIWFPWLGRLPNRRGARRFLALWFLTLGD